MNSQMLISYAATVCFSAAVLHTFFVKAFLKIADTFSEGSFRRLFFHLLSEVEVVFGFWAVLFILFFLMLGESGEVLSYLKNQNFTEPTFVFVIMVVCASRPVLVLAEQVIRTLSRALPWSQATSFYVATLVVGPLLGSFITEPAAMTVTALILSRNFYDKQISTNFKYATLGLLFVNVSIGGTLTPYAAPPVLMVANRWGWDLSFMLFKFGLKAIVAVVTSTGIIAYQFRSELKAFPAARFSDSSNSSVPPWVFVLHVGVLVSIVAASHFVLLFLGIFLGFLGLVFLTRKYHDEIKFREPFLVGFFLSGLVILGGFQSWWLEPILIRLSALPLYLGAISLTAITDNAALTYLGSQVAGLSDVSKYALVAGSVVGGGLTVIANAPNPAGYGILRSAFGSDGISAAALFKHALLPTLIAGLCFWTDT
ncbi:MAG: putative Na+/H+ antiporter [Bdellovibrionales bacterium]|nr:putative Na+/H+ antiporter [Bdellovibrionales bacterium]